MSRSSLGRNAAWSLAGNTFYSFAQWLLLVVLVRVGSAELAGEFALALAIAAPVYLCLGLNLRVVLATDARREWPLVDYLRLRLGSSCLAAAVIVILGLALPLEWSTVAVLLAVAGSKASEAQAQTLYGYFQLCERMDIVTRSLMTRAVLGSGLFVGALALSGRLVFACLGLWAGWSVTLWMHDRPAARELQLQDSLAAGVPGPRQPLSNPGLQDRLPSPAAARPTSEWNWAAMRRLAHKAAPLGVDAGINSVTINLPRYVVAATLSAASLGVFAVLAYFAQVVGMITGSVADPVVSRLALYYAGGQRRAFMALLAKLTMFGLAVTAVCVASAAMIGPFFMEVLLGREFVDTPLLVVLMLGAGLRTIQQCLGRGLQAAHRFWQFLAVDVVTLAVVSASCLPLTAAYGVVGAAWSFCAGCAAGIAANLAFLIPVLSSVARRSDRGAAMEDPCAPPARKHSGPRGGRAWVPPGRGVGG